ncbi:MAG: hypothetical protein ACI4UM_09145 [Succinivibrio sp.]
MRLPGHRLLLAVLAICVLFISSCSSAPKSSEKITSQITTSELSDIMRSIKSVNSLYDTLGQPLELRTDKKSGGNIMIWKVYDSRGNFYPKGSEYSDHFIETARSIRVYTYADSIKSYTLTGTVYANRRGFLGQHSKRVSFRNMTKKELSVKRIPLLPGEDIKRYKKFYRIK